MRRNTVADAKKLICGRLLKASEYSVAIETREAATLKNRFIVKKINLIVLDKKQPSSWSSGNGGRIRLWSVRSEVQISASQIGHSVANGWPLLRHFFRRSCVARAQ